MTLPASIAARAVLASSRDEWLALRGLGGSEVAAIRGRSPFAGPWDVWCARQPEVERVDTDSPVKAEGRWLEEIVVGRFEAETGREVTRTPHLIVRHPDFPWATGSPDGLVGDDEGIEIKTIRTGEPFAAEGGTVIERYTPEVDDVVLPHWSDQTYFYMELTGFSAWTIAAWVPQPWGYPRLVWVRLLADRDHQKRILLDVVRFYDRHIVGGEMPDPDGSRAHRAWLDRKIAPKKTVREATPEEAELVTRLMWIRERRKVAEGEEGRVEAAIAERFGTETYSVHIPGLRCTRAVNGRISLKPERA